MNPLIQLKTVSLPILIAVAFACFGRSPRVQAADETTSNANTGEGLGALEVVTTGGSNTAVGFGALFNNISGNANTATGAFALFRNTAAGPNTATGVGALFTNNGGTRNTADGVQALFMNTDGGDNTAVGDSALSSNIDGFSNTAVGYRALFSTTTVSHNAGSDNTAVGRRALENNTTGSFNIAIGDSAGEALITGNSNIYIGNEGADESNTIRIGFCCEGAATATFIGGISGVNEGGDMIEPVYINTLGRLGTQAPPSSRRFKKEIKPMDKASEAILALKPVTFRFKSDDKGALRFGLIAEEVAAVNPDLIVRDEKGDIYSVRYDAVNAMLLNEFLKEHRKNEQQEATIARQQQQIDALTAGLQKVSAQVELNKSAPRTVLNSP